MSNLSIDNMSFDECLGYGNHVTYFNDIYPSKFSIQTDDSSRDGRLSKLCRENIGKDNYIFVYKSFDACPIIYFRNEQDMLYFKLIESAYVWINFIF